MNKYFSSTSAAAIIFEMIKVFILLGAGFCVGSNFVFAPILVPAIVIYVSLSLLVKNLWSACESQ